MHVTLQQWLNDASWERTRFSNRGIHLWDGSVVPDVALVRKHVGYIAQIALLGVLYERIEGVFGGNLRTIQQCGGKKFWEEHKNALEFMTNKRYKAWVVAKYIV